MREIKDQHKVRITSLYRFVPNLPVFFLIGLMFIMLLIGIIIELIMYKIKFFTLPI